MRCFILMTFVFRYVINVLFFAMFLCPPWNEKPFRVRGRLGTLLIFTMSLGILMGYILGAVMDFHTMPLCLLMISNIFLAGVIIVHDSPMYLLRKSRFRVSNGETKSKLFSWKLNIKIVLSYFLSRCLQQHAENALKFYRGHATTGGGEMNSKLKLEYDNMTCMIKMANCDSSKGKITLGDFRKAFV